MISSPTRASSGGASRRLSPALGGFHGIWKWKAIVASRIHHLHRPCHRLLQGEGVQRVPRQSVKVWGAGQGRALFASLGLPRAGVTGAQGSGPTQAHAPNAAIPGRAD